MKYITELVEIFYICIFNTLLVAYFKTFPSILSDKGMVDELCSGPILALEINTNVENFRVHCGPVDVEMAKSLRPETIRAKFGLSKIKNAVHCTDFEEDAVEELCYMFDILVKGE